MANITLATASETFTATTEDLGGGDLSDRWLVLMR